jgi:hypothetical protein
MPNIMRQALTPDSIYLQASDGSECEIQQLECKAHWKECYDEDVQVAWLRDLITASLGSDVIPADCILIEIDGRNGVVSELSITNGVLQ